MADKTLVDVNGDETVFQLADADRATLAAAIVLTDNYKGGGQTVQYTQGFLDNASVYDPVAQAATIQAQIDALTAQLGPIQAAATKISNPAQHI